MRYNVKQLSQLSELSPARIRKWQERYKLLSPERGGNGYWYYSTTDLIILKNVKTLLDDGKRISDILRLGNETLVNKSTPDFTETELSSIRDISNNYFHKIELDFDTFYEKHNYIQLIKDKLSPMVVLVGEAWHKKYLSVADEHAFSRWLHSYIYSRFVKKIETEQEPIWLVATFPEDRHELGGLLHYARLTRWSIPCKLVGEIPLNELIHEIQKGHYRVLSLSVVLPTTPERIDNITREIYERTNIERILIGGRSSKNLNMGVRKQG
ncbi:MAG: MerR family transcriptional regulator [Spirochaetota bacterium]